MWKDISGYEGKYQISDEGEVLSLNYNNTGKPRLLKQKINKLGFLEVKLSKNNKTKDFMVARLVAEHFIPNNKNCDVVINIDGDRLNCHKDNLQWVFHSEQRHLMYNKGKRKIGKPSGNIISYRNKGYKKYSDIAKDYNMKPKNFYKRLNRGWSIEEIVNIPVDEKNKGGKPKFYEYYGKLMTVKQISKLTGISSKLINKRLGYGWNIYESAEIMKGR